MLLGSATFLLVVALTVWIGWKKQESVEISLAKQRVHEMALHLRTNLRAADDAVAQLAVWSNGFAHQVPYAGSSGLRRAVLQAMQSSEDGEFTLDALSALPAQDRLGQILGLSSIQATGTANGASHLDLALSLLDRLGTGQATSPFLRWTYFYTAGEDMLAISPWTPSQVLLGEHNGVRDFLHSSWQYYDVASAEPATREILDSGLRRSGRSRLDGLSWAAGVLGRTFCRGGRGRCTSKLSAGRARLIP